MIIELYLKGHNEVSPAKYVKVSGATDVDKLFKLLTSKSYWKNLKKPKMLISVSGGTRIDVSSEFKKKFCQGLYKATKTTGSFLLISFIKNQINYALKQ